jgi:hypothetical protein
MPQLEHLRGGPILKNRPLQHPQDPAFLTREAAQLLFQALVVSLLDYCSSLLA